MFSSRLAVHTNRTREKSTGTSRKWSTNVPFCRDPLAYPLAYSLDSPSRNPCVPLAYPVSIAWVPMRANATAQWANAAET
jgi:hypothetical protein